MKAKASVSHFTNCIFFRDILEYNTVKSTHDSCTVRAMMTMNDNGRFTILYDAQCSYQLFLIYRVRLLDEVSQSFLLPHHCHYVYYED